MPAVILKIALGCLIFGIIVIVVSFGILSYRLKHQDRKGNHFGMMPLEATLFTAGTVLVLSSNVMLRAFCMRS